MKSIEIVKIEMYRDSYVISSRTIADELGKKHQHILEKVRKVLTLSEYRQREYTYGNNNKAFEYLLNKDSFILLVMNYEGFNDFKRAYIKYFNELEQQNKKQLPSSFSEALQLAADQAKQLELQAPKVALAEESIRDTTTHYSITNAGKQIGLSQSKIFNLMRDKRLLTVKKLPTQSALDRKILTIRTNLVGGKNRPQAVMTMENIFNFKKIYEKDFN